MRTAARWWAAGLVVVVAVVAFAPLPARADVTSAGSVAVTDRMGQRDLVTFYFRAGAPHAAEQVRAAAVAGRLPVLGLVTVTGTDDGLLRVRLATTVGRHTGLFARRVPAATLQALDLFHQGHVVLQLHPAAEVDGHPPPIHHDVFARKFDVPTGADVTYRVPLDWWARVVAVVLVLLGLPFVVIRTWAATIERRPEDPVDQVHRLQVGLAVAYAVLPPLSMALVVLGGLLLVPDMVLSEALPAVGRWRPTVALAPIVLLMAAFVATAVAGFLGAQPVDRRLRQTDESAGASARRLTRVLVVMLLPLTVWFGFRALTPNAGPATVTAGLVAFLAAVNLLAPLLIRAAQPTYRLEDPLRRRLLALCDAHGLPVRDVRGIRTRSVRVANAMITGLAPRLREVLITDYLLDNLDDGEVDAILAHEIGHGVGHHLLVKAGATVGLVLVAELGIALTAVNGAFGLLGLVAVVGIFVLPGRLGIALEERADDYACAQVGVEPVVRALEALASLNMTKRRTGGFWNAMQQHPGVEQRIGRLQDRATVASRSPGQVRGGGP